MADELVSLDILGLRPEASCLGDLLLKALDIVIARILKKKKKKKLENTGLTQHPCADERRLMSDITAFQSAPRDPTWQPKTTSVQNTC